MFPGAYLVRLAIQVQDPLRRGTAGCGPGLEFPRKLAAAAHQAAGGTVGICGHVFTRTGSVQFREFEIHIP